MSKKKATKKKSGKFPVDSVTGKNLTMAEMIERAKTMLPSARMIICEGCFSPRNTLTVKFHLEQVWSRKQMEFDENDPERMVKLPCKNCHQTREITFGAVSWNFFLQDWKNKGNDGFVLLKDDKFKVLVGLNPTQMNLGDFLDE